jgi:dTDP-4-dehydrorhamnose reductase
MSNSPTILITGSTGQVGGALLRLFPDAEAPARERLDLSSEASVRACIRSVKPRWILNPAAYTAVDKAESEPELAHAINTDAPRILGEEAVRIGASVIHFSTDYVFDGEKATPYTEQDATAPTSVYGRTKLAGEKALAASGAAHLILRTSWVYGSTGKNFLLTVLRLAEQRAELNIVADQHGTPTAARDLASLTAQIIALDPDLRERGGLFHATSLGETTWHGFATEFLRQSAVLRPSVRYAKLNPIPSSAYPTPAKRPANSRLNCDKLQQTLGLSLPPWQQSLSAVLAELEPSH